MMLLVLLTLQDCISYELDRIMGGIADVAAAHSNVPGGGKLPEFFHRRTEPLYQPAGSHQTDCICISKWITLTDSQGSSNLLGDDHTAQVVNPPDNSSCFHIGTSSNFLYRQMYYLP